MAKKPVATETDQGWARSFKILLSQDAELSALRVEYSRASASKRRASAEWAYDESLAVSLFSAALPRVQAGETPPPKWPFGFAALAIDPDYAPALLTVGCHEYASGRHSEGMDLLLGLVPLPPDTPDWIEIIDKAGDFLMDAGDPGNTCRLYEELLKVHPAQQEFILGMAWALCRAGRQTDALPWFQKATANAPQDSAVLSDCGWALVELGRFEEAQTILEAAVRLAPTGYHMPANNLARLRQLRKSRDPGQSR